MKKWIISLAVIPICLLSCLGQSRHDSVIMQERVDSLFIKASHFYQNDDMTSALSVYDTILMLVEPKKFYYAKALKGKGQCFRLMGNYNLAEQFFIDGKNVWENFLDTTQTGYADILNDLGVLYNEVGNYEKSDNFYQRCLKIKINKYGKFHSQYAQTLNNLANNCNDMGQYEVAEKLYKDVKILRDSLFGNESKESNNVLLGLGSLYYKKGFYEKAEEAFRNFLSILRKLKMQETRDYAAGLMNLASTIQELGQMNEAKTLYIESIKIIENIEGKENLDYAYILNDLAQLYKTIGNYSVSESHFLEAKSIIKQVIGNENPSYALILDNLADLYSNMERYEDSRKLFFESITIREKTIGTNHLDYAQVLNNLASLYCNMNKFDSAIIFFRRAKSIFEFNGNEQSLHYGQILNNLAVTFAELKLFDKSDSFFLLSAPIFRNQLVRATRSLSEKEVYAYTLVFEHDIEGLLSCNHEFIDSSRELIKINYDNTLFYKGFLLQSALSIKNHALTKHSTAQIWNELSATLRRISIEYVKPISERDSSELVQFENQANDLEKDLARHFAEFNNAYRTVYWNDVRKKLRDEEVAIEFVKFNKYFPIPSDSLLYAALIIRTNLDRPYFVPLFEERQLSQLLDCKGLDLSECISMNYSISKTSPLYNLIIKPLEPYLKDVRKIIFSPTGQLHLIDIPAIGIGSDSILSQKYHLIQVGSTRQLIDRDSIFDKIDQPTAVLFGGVKYEADNTAIEIANANLDTIQTISSRGPEELRFSYMDSSMQSQIFKYLEGTAKEIHNIKPFILKQGIGVTTYLGFEASEEAFKQIGVNSQPPRILHIATHGFFFPFPKSKNITKLELNIGDPVFKNSTHPMIRSGLILAGANQAWKTGKPIHPNMEDGILTAYEISQSNLRGTELVVLSACQTGLGDIHSNEGIYGLQRAFKIAGARYLIMSLWSVPDIATQEFMTLFYQKWLTEKQTLPEAFQSTQSIMRLKYKTKPVNWAGWVLME